MVLKLTVIAEEPAANPIEKQIFFRLCKLLRLNIQPIFAFDGPGRPWKRGKTGGGRVDWDRIRLFRQMLDSMRIPYHNASAEAEAECAQLQREGFVDAVWSDDGDTLMFGAEILIRDLREVGSKKAQKSDTHMRVYRASDIKTKHGLDREGLVCFAMLSGGGYNTVGLKGCGPVLAQKLARSGLAPSLCAAQNDRDLIPWRQHLGDCLHAEGKRLVVARDFLRFLPVKNYSRPKVSTREQLLAYRGVQIGWDRPLDHNKLREIMFERFNTYISKGYLTWIAPFVLAHRLASTTNGLEGTNTHLDIRLVKPSAWKCPNGQTPCNLLKVSFKCAEVLPECKQVRSIVTRKDESIEDALNDPLQRQECEILRYTLVRGLGEAYFDKQADNDERAPKLARKRTPKAKKPVDDGKADTAKRSGKRSIE
ncbi:hypothetical protein LTS18_003179 [Coniosporium uncinatum]|uniref:Uncharacterized protein n=1 Tax=Coniosporium uncinatum TaxID=93489 RepID=A0ACC3D7N3_9PEZI|nr:hypothetical protein LTS18_003179 [Coniosporium uncinatum]